MFSISDCLYLYETAVGTYSNGSPTDLGWVAGCVLLAWAAWQPRGAEPAAAIEGWPLLVAPVGFGLLGLARAAVRPLAPRAPARAHARQPVDPRRDRAHGAHLRREHAHARALARRRRTPTSSPGLGNRRRLLIDLEQRLAPRARRASRSRCSTSTASSSTTTRSAIRPATRCSAASARTSRASSRGAARPTAWAATSSASSFESGDDPPRLRRSPAPSARCPSTARASTSARRTAWSRCRTTPATRPRRSASPTSACTRRRRPAA